MNYASIISIGGELTRGEVDNTNALYISRGLTDKGIEISSILAIPDDYECAVDIIKMILKDSGIYIITGGLGGTRDDITRRVVAKVLNRKLCIDDEKKHKLKNWYEKKKRHFKRVDMMQASYPKGGHLLDNRYGLAYGFWIRDGKRIIFSLPGVPKEMEWMFDNEVIPILERESLFDSSYHSELLTFAGIPEYTLDRKVGEIVSRYSGLRYGTMAGYGITKVKLESRGVDIDPCIAKLKMALDKHFICRGGGRLEKVVGNLLLKKKLFLSVAESCTAGYLSKIITDVSGSSRYFLGGVVAYSNIIKKEILDVSDKTLNRHGAVSSQTAIEMAKGVQKKFGSNIALSVTGIAGPEGGTPSRPVGTVYICVFRNREEPWVEKYLFSGDRDVIRYRSVLQALFMLYTILRREL